MQENRNAENMTLLMIEKAAKQCILIARRAYSLGPWHVAVFLWKTYTR